MLLKGVLEAPVDTGQDILDRGMTPFVFQSSFLLKVLKQSSNPAHRQLYEMCDDPKNHDERMKMLEDDVQGAGTHVFISDVLQWDGDYHFSNEVLQGITPYQTWIVNKMWSLNEDLAVHLLRYQQVCIIIMFMWMT